MTNSSERLRGRLQNRATCFAKFLQNELNSDVARFISHELDCLATNQVAVGCRKLRVVLLFATKSVHVLCFTGPRETCFAASDVNPVCGRLQAVSLFSVVRRAKRETRTWPRA